MKLNKLDYLQYQGVNVMLAHDFYPKAKGWGGDYSKRVKSSNQ